MKPSFLDSADAELCRSIKGCLSMMPLSDLIQWVELSRHSGTLVADNNEMTRYFYFQEGKLIFVWSDSDGERFCDELHKQIGLPLQRLKEHIQQAERLEISILGLLSCNEGIQLEHLTKLMTALAERSLSKALNWKSGRFSFTDHLPAAVLSSPVVLHTSQVLFESAIQLDEDSREDQPPPDPLIHELFDHIARGTIDLPPMPTEMQMVMNRISAPDLSIDEIIECITDPLLVSKVLKVCNSSFYGLRGKVGTMREAVVYMGLKSLTSIITVHALSGFSSRNAEQVQQILHHSMMVGMVAKQLARDMGHNHDQAFVCGLLHDLGWIVMLELLAGYDLATGKRDLMIQQHHAELGGLVAEQWNFSEEIQESIRFHHEPTKAQEYAQLVEIIYLADLIAKNEAPPPDGNQLLHHQVFDDIQPFNDHLEALDREIEAILAPA